MSFQDRCRSSDPNSEHNRRQTSFCSRQARKPADPTATKRAAQKRYREAHAEQYREYARRQREAKGVGLNPHLDNCPECGRLKRKANAVCRECNRKSQRTTRAETKCWSCDVQMRPLEWHGRQFMRCPSCGLEIGRPGLYTEEAA